MCGLEVKVYLTSVSSELIKKMQANTMKIHFQIDESSLFYLMAIKEYENPYYYLLLILTFKIVRKASVFIWNQK
jgi:hypothetical protein